MHVFVGKVNFVIKSLILQDKCNIEIFLSPENYIRMKCIHIRCVGSGKTKKKICVVQVT